MANSRRSRIVLRTRFFAAVLILAAGALWFIKSLEPHCTQVSGSDVLFLNVNNLGRGDAETFCFRDSDGGKVRFVLARGSDGRIRTVLDACGQCYRYGMGYKLAGHELICRYCGNQYSINNMTSGKASCVPIGLRFEEHGGVVRIQVADLRENRDYFAGLSFGEAEPARLIQRVLDDAAGPDSRLSLLEKRLGAPVCH
jgi:uncharacterized membrane protein